MPLLADRPATNPVGADRSPRMGMTVTLYTRAQCCCCGAARDVLDEYRERFGFRFEEVDATDPDLVALIGPTVPVVAVDGRVRFRGEVNRVLFDRLIAARLGSG